MWITLAGLAAILAAGVAGYQIAAQHYQKLDATRQRQLERELEMMLSLFADINDHRSKGESDVADWKFEQGHGRLDEYIRDGGPDPTQFVPDIVGEFEIPAEEGVQGEADDL